MSETRTNDSFLVAYIDGALQPAMAAEVEARIAEDAELAARVRLLRLSTDQLKESFEADLFVPDRVRRNAIKALQAGRFVRLATIAMSVAAALVFAVAAGTFELSGRGNPAAEGLDYFLQEVSEYHAVYEKETTHLVEVPASQVAEIHSWLGARIGFPLSIPDLRSQGLQLMGARLLVVDERPVAQLMYTDATGARIALCAGSSPMPDTPTSHFVAHQNTRVFGTAKDGRFFIVAGPSERLSLIESLSNKLPDLLTAQS